MYIQATVPRWQVHNEAALFWRAKGNGSRALQCLRNALSSAPPSHRHLILTNAANLLLHHGLTNHAQAQLEQALALNASEVTAPWCLTVFCYMRLCHGLCIIFTQAALRKRLSQQELSLQFLLVPVFLSPCSYAYSIRSAKNNSSNIAITLHILPIEWIKLKSSSLLFAQIHLSIRFLFVYHTANRRTLKVNLKLS